MFLIIIYSVVGIALLILIIFAFKTLINFNKQLELIEKLEPEILEAAQKINSSAKVIEKFLKSNIFNKSGKNSSKIIDDLVLNKNFGEVYDVVKKQKNNFSKIWDIGRNIFNKNDNKDKPKKK